MRRFVLILSIMALFVAVFAVFATAEDAAHEYVGAAKCKMCHKAQFTAWSETPHAKAFDVLSDEEKTKEECVGCHISGKLADGTVLEGVECEACHGPGADYKSSKIMSKKKWAEDPEGQMKLAVEAGLVMPTEETCVRCHTKEGNPNFKEFDFATAKDKVHPVAEEE